MLSHDSHVLCHVLSCESPTLQVPEGSSSQRSASPIVRDPRRRRQEEGLGRPAVEEPMDVRVKEEEEEEIEVSGVRLGTRPYICAFV